MRRRWISIIFLVACSRDIRGPSPVVQGIVNPREPAHTPGVVCNAQGDPAAGWPVDLLGKDFSPMPTGVLTDRKGVAMPEVTLSGPETWAVPRERAFFFDSGRLALFVPTRDSAMPKELPPGKYGASVKNPNGRSGALADALIVVPPPTITSVRLAAPADGVELEPIVCVDEDQRLVIHGRNFRTDAEPVVTVGNKVLAAADVTVDGAERITAIVRGGTFAASEASDAGTTQSVKIASPEGCVAPYGADPSGFGVTAVKAATKPHVEAVHVVSGGVLWDPGICQDATDVTLQLDGGSLWSIGGASGAVVPEVELQSAGARVARASLVTVEPADPAGAPTFSGTRVVARFALMPPIRPGALDLRLTCGNGCTVTVPAAVRVNPRPTLSSVTPNPVNNHSDTTITLTGSGFLRDTTSGAIPRVTIRTAGAAAISLGGVAYRSETMLEAVVAAGTPQGVYDVTVTNPDGCAVTAVGLLTVTGLELGALAIDPRFGWKLRNQAITIYNSPAPPQQQFSGGAPEVWLRAPLRANPAQMAEIPLRRVAFLDASTITAVVPDCSGLAGTPFSDATCASGIQPGGPYALRVRDPSGAEGTVAAAQGFTVLENAPPTVTALSPSAIDTGGLPSAIAPELVVTGTGFDAMAELRILSAPATGVLRSCALPVTMRSPTQLRATVPTSLPAASCADRDALGNTTASTAGFSLAVGLFPIRVQRMADPAYVDFSGLVVTQPSANPTQGPLVSTRLQTARADFPLVTATDDLGSQFLYAIGGSDGTNALASVEVAQITSFGDVGGDCTMTPCRFRTLERTPLGATAATARRGAQVVVRTIAGDTSYLFALGGEGTGGQALPSVERAQVLKASDAPVLAEPEAGTGTLRAGTYYYRVSALLGAVHATNPGGETLPSDFVTARVPTAGGGIGLAWGCVPGAARYRVYRTPAPNDRAGTELQLAEVDAAQMCAMAAASNERFTDGGARAPSGAKPLPPGALSRWVAVGSLGTARAHAAARLVGDDLLVVGGGAGGGALASVERARFSAGRFDLGAFAVTGAGLGTARQRHSMAVANAASAPNSFLMSRADDAWLVVAGGDAGAAALGSIEIAQVRSGGMPVDPVFSAGSYNTFASHGGWVEVVANILFQAGTTAGTGFGFRSNYVCPGMGNRVGECTAAGSFSGTLNATSIAYRSGGARYLAGETLFRAYVFVAGGFASDAGGTPTDSIERIVY